MKIVMNAMEKIEGIATYPMIALIIFFTFFVLVTILVIKTDKKQIEEMSNLPLDKVSDFQMDKKNEVNI